LRRCYDCARAGCKWAQSSTALGCTPPSWSCTSQPGRVFCCYWFVCLCLRSCVDVVSSLHKTFSPFQQE